MAFEKFKRNSKSSFKVPKPEKIFKTAGSLLKVGIGLIAVNSLIGYLKWETHYLWNPRIKD